MSEDILDDVFFADDPRTIEERELDILKSWLIRPNWCLGLGPGQNMFNGYSEAVCVLAGVDPEFSMGDRRQGFMWVLLPGVREKYVSQLSQWNFDRALLEDLTYFSGLQPRGARPVAEIISHALDSGFKIPWLEAALADDECRNYLPDSLLENKRESKIAPVISKMSLAQSKRAKEWAEKNKKTIALNKLGRPLFEKWCHSPEKSRGSKSKLADKILEALQGKFPNEVEPRTKRTILRHIGKWTREKEAGQQAE